MASTGPAAEPPVKRQKIDEERSLLKNLPADQFMR